MRTVDLLRMGFHGFIELRMVSFATLFFFLQAQGIVTLKFDVFFISLRDMYLV